MNLLSNPHHPHVDPCHYHPCIVTPEPSTFVMICIALALGALFVWIKGRKD
jgi:hypothetical protein